MKRTAVLLAILSIFTFHGGSYATFYSALLYPRLNGNDVLVPDILVDTIRLTDKTEFDYQRTVYAASEINHWLKSFKELAPKVIEASRMIKGTDYWRARDLRDHKFIPCQINDEGNPVCAILETIYQIPERGKKTEFIDNSFDCERAVLFIK